MLVRVWIETSAMLLVAVGLLATAVGIGSVWLEAVAGVVFLAIGFACLRAMFVLGATWAFDCVKDDIRGLDVELEKLINRREQDIFSAFDEKLDEWIASVTEDAA